MNAASNSEAVNSADAPRMTPAALPQIRLLEWCIRRELWENRFVYIAPLAVSALVLFGTSINMASLPHRRQAALLLDPARQQASIERPYDLAAMTILFTGFLVAIFYCLDALHGERRDRSILFWKSLPVSDWTTVLAKASVPLLVLPLLTFAIVAGAQVVLFLLSSAILAGNGMGAEAFRQQFVPSPQALLVGVVVSALWHAPIYGWLLLISAWAKRAAFLWAFLPFMALSAFESGAFHTSYIGSFLRYRMAGWLMDAFVPLERGHVALRPLSRLSPETWFGRPGLWIGVLVAAALLAGAVQLRRNREPI